MPDRSRTRGTSRLRRPRSISSTARGASLVLGEAPTEIQQTSPTLDWSEGAGLPFSVLVERSPVNKAVLNSMTKTERRLVSETEREALVERDGDALLELHSRVRRARTKYVKTYRRAASGRVVESGSRGIAYPKNQRDRDKAEVFELALARVSRQVGVGVKGAAGELRAEGP